MVCAFCGASVMHDRWMAHRKQFAYALDDERRTALASGGERIELDGRSYLVLSALARGEGTDVLLAERADGVRERVVLQVLREASDAPRFERSCEALGALRRQ